MKPVPPHIILMLLLAAAAAMAQPRTPVVRSLTIHGDTGVEEREIRRVFGLEAGARFAADELQRHGRELLHYLAGAGYLYARIDSMRYQIAADSSNAAVALYLAAGRPVRMGQVKVSGLDSAQTQQLKERFNTRPGGPLDAERLDADIEDALLQMDKQGYPFARFELGDVRLDSLDTSRDALDMQWRTARGPRLILREIQISGNQLTKPGVILREIRIKPGEPYSQEKVERIPARLMKLGYFKRVDEPLLFYSTGDQGGLLLTVEEGQSSRFDGVLGYTPGSSGSQGYFTGLVDISLGNLLGTGRQLRAHWQKKDRQTQDISLYYREPWLAGLPLHVGGGFAQLIQDTTYVQRNLSLDIALPLLENLTILAQVNRSQVIPDSLGSYRFGLLRSSELNGVVGLEYDSRDDRINPRQGLFYATTYQSGRKKNLGPEALLTAGVKRTADTKRITLDLEFYTQPFKRQILAWMLHGRQIRSSEAIIPVTDQFRLGGAQTLRGYREDQFRGSAVAWTSLEYRYWMGRRSRTFLFADYGYFSAATMAGRIENFKLGYGIGFRLETGLGVMGLDYGLGRGDDLFAGKVHVGLINEF